MRSHHALYLVAIVVGGGALYSRATSTDATHAPREHQEAIPYAARPSRAIAQPRVVDGEPATPVAPPIEQRADGFEETLLRSPVDGAWSLDVERRARAAFAGSNLALRDLRCGGTICKLTVDNNEETRGELRVALATLPAKRMHGRPGAAGSMVVYLEQ